VEGYTPPTLAGHREYIVSVAFAGDAGDHAYTVSKDGAVFEWKLVDDDDDNFGAGAGGAAGGRGGTSRLDGGDGTTMKRWKMEGKHFFHQPAKLTCAAGCCTHPLPLLSFSTFSLRHTRMFMMIMIHQSQT
jgi:periodic tryptophan protein 2